MYPVAGSDRPHAAEHVGADTYGYDANGDMSSRTGGGQPAPLVWNVERQLSSVSGPAGTTSFVYDAGGERLYRSDPTGRTVLFAGQEITANAAGTNVSATRRARAGHGRSAG